MTVSMEHVRPVLESLDRGQPERARDLCKALLAEHPGDFELQHLLALTELECGAPGAALTALEALRRQRPEDPQLLSNLGIAYLRCERPGEALPVLEAAVALAPQNPDFAFNVGLAAAAVGDFARAQSAYRRVLADEPRHADALYHLAGLLVRQDAFTEALQLLEPVATAPGVPDKLLCSLAIVLERLNRPEDAAHVLARVGDTALPAFRLVAARLDRRAGRAASAARDLRRFLAEPGSETIGAETLGSLYQQLALCSDAAGEHDGVLQAAERAKRLWRSVPPAASGTIYIKRVRVLAAQRQLPSLEAADGLPPTPARLVSFVGFPRSGTTLMERLLAAHPAVAAVDERDYLGEAVLPLLREGRAPLHRDDLLQARRGYFGALAAGSPETANARIVIDKQPLNIVYCRWIDSLFPEARILVALRDPRDVVLSCLLQRFNANPAMRNLDSLEESARLYAEAMGLWCDARAGLRIPWLEYRYEDLAADTRACLTRVFDFIGLDADPEQLNQRRMGTERVVMTPSYERVGQAIDASAIGRWQPYGEAFAAVDPLLGPFVRAFGYDA